MSVVTLYKVWLSQTNEGLPIVGYDLNGVRRVIQIAENNALLVHMDGAVTIDQPITAQIVDSDVSPIYVNLQQVDGEPVDVGNGAAGLGTQRVTIASDNDPVDISVTNFPTETYYQENTGIVADATAGTTINMTANPVANFTLVVLRTAGATDVVAVTLQGSMDNSTFVATGTAVTSVAGGFGTTTLSNTPWRYIRAFVTTVGAGNTLTTQVLAAR